MILSTIAPIRLANSTDRGMIDAATKENRLVYCRYLASHGVVFTNESEDTDAFECLLAENQEVAAYLRDTSDHPAIQAMYLMHRFPHVFFAIEQTYRVLVDFMTRRCKRTVRPDGEKTEDSTRRPPDFWKLLSDDNVPLVANYRLRTEIRSFNADPAGHLLRLQAELDGKLDARERMAIGLLITLFSDIGKMCFPAFKEHIKESALPFPSMHVRLWIKEILERGSVLICGDVGTQKTSAAVVGLQELGVRRTLVVARSYARTNVWKDDLGDYYRDAPAVLVLKGAKDLKLMQEMSTEDLLAYSYVVMGYGDVQQKNGDAWVEALARYEPEAVIVDEAHAINHENKRSGRVTALARLPSVRYRVLLTATPFENEPNEMATIATILRPDEYPTREAFLQQCQNNPRLFYRLAQELMCAYFSADDVLDLPPCNWGQYTGYPTVMIEPCASALAALDLIRYDEKLYELVQITRMNQLLACPFLARNWYQYPPEVNGYLRDPLKSDKLRWLKGEIEARWLTGKVVVASGLFKEAITRGIAGVDDPDDMYVVANQLRKWFGEEAVLVIDGSTDPSDDPQIEESRAAVMYRWKNDPKARILVASVQATAESINLTLRKDSGCDKLSILMLTLPFKSTQLDQFLGRFRRPGMELPAELLIPILRGTPDEAMLSLVRQKKRNFLIGLQGIRLLKEELDALGKMLNGSFLRTPADWLDGAYRRVREQGEDRAIAFLRGTYLDREAGETFARYYLAAEEMSLSGDVSRFLAKVYKPWLKEGRVSGEQILDAACGPLSLERRLGEPVFGIDLNPGMIDVARPHSYNAGKNARVGRLSDLPSDWNGTFRLSVCSLALHWSSNKGGWNKSERVKILRNLARVTAKDGIVHLVCLRTSFSEEMLGEWTDALTVLGLARVPELTGLIKSVDSPERPRTFWSVCLQKVGEPTGEEGSHAALAFADERRRMTESVNVGPKGKETKAKVPPTLVKHDAFVIVTDEGTKTPESASNTAAERFTDVASWCKPFVTILREEYGPCEEWMLLLVAELNRTRPTKLTHFSRIWDALFHRNDAPKMRREKFRSIAKRAMTLEPSP